MPRPRKHLPPGAREYIMAAAESGALKETTVARGLGLSLSVFRRILRDDPDAKALWDEALATERDNIVARMHQLAMEGDTKAAQFLLAARHGLRERGEDSADSGGRVVIQLPGSVSEAEYERMIQADKARLPEDGRDG